jgi:hypothetical protein
MPLDPGNPYYRAETTSAQITELGRKLKTRYGRPADAFGAKGNLVHYSGYHRSENWILNSPDSTHGSRDYSVRQPLDVNGEDPDAICAFDWSPGSTAQMIVQTKRLRAAARASDPRLFSLREIAGTEDGDHVVTFYAQGGGDKAPFDPSHLSHIHGSFWRSRQNRDHTGIYEVMAGIGPDLDEGAPMYLFTKQASGVVGLTTGLAWRWVTAAELPHIQALHSEGTQPLTYNGQVRTLAFWPGECLGVRPDGVPVPVLEQEILDAFPHLTADLDAQDIQDLAEAIAANPDTPFTAEQVAQLVAAANTAEDS